MIKVKGWNPLISTCLATIIVYKAAKEIIEVASFNRNERYLKYNWFNNTSRVSDCLSEQKVTLKTSGF